MRTTRSLILFLLVAITLMACGGCGDTGDCPSKRKPCTVELRHGNPHVPHWSRDDYATDEEAEEAWQDMIHHAAKRADVPPENVVIDRGQVPRWRRSDCDTDEEAEAALVEFERKHLGYVRSRHGTETIDDTEIIPPFRDRKEPPTCRCGCQMEWTGDYCATCPECGTNQIFPTSVSVGRWKE